MIFFYFLKKGWVVGLWDCLSFSIFEYIKYVKFKVVLEVGLVVGEGEWIGLFVIFRVLIL